MISQCEFITHKFSSLKTIDESKIKRAKTKNIVDYNMFVCLVCLIVCVVACECVLVLACMCLDNGYKRLGKYGLI